MGSQETVFDFLKHRNETDWQIILWIVLGLLLMLAILYFGNRLRHRIQGRHNNERGFQALERLGTEKGLSFEDQVKLGEMADVAKLKNPALLLDSVTVFDKTVAIWMRRAMKLPWLEMEDEVVWLKKVRKQIGFRYLPEGFSPSSTRELPRGTQIFAVIAHDGRLRLLVSGVLGLDDFSLHLAPFKDEDNELVRIKTQLDFWCFIWPTKGGEYRFESQVLKVYALPDPVLLVQHGDGLLYEPDQSMFACEVDLNATLKWASAERMDIASADAHVFEDVANIKTLPVRINGLSSTWFRIDFIEGIEKEDLVCIGTDEHVPNFLFGQIGRVIRSGGRGIFCRFLDFSIDKREALLRFLIQGISVETFQERVKQKPR